MAYLGFKVNKNIMSRLKYYCASHSITQNQFLELAISEQFGSDTKHFYNDKILPDSMTISNSYSDSFTNEIKLMAAKNGTTVRAFCTTAIIKKLNAVDDELPAKSTQEIIISSLNIIEQHIGNANLETCEILTRMFECIKTVYSNKGQFLSEQLLAELAQKLHELANLLQDTACTSVQPLQQKAN